MKEELSSLSLSSYFNKPETQENQDPLDGRSHEREVADTAFLTAPAGSDFSGSPWQALLELLEELAAELKRNPTQEAVAELKGLAEELSTFGFQLPHRERPIVERIEQRHEELISYLSGLTRDIEFEWLDVHLIAQIASRWRIAIVDREAVEQLAELESDAEAALDRTQEASKLYVHATQLVQESRTGVEQAATKVSAAKSFGERAVAKRAHAAAQKNELDAQSVTLSTQEALIDAASPFSSPFDHSEDYVRQLELRTTQALMETAIPAPDPDTDTDTDTATVIPVAGIRIEDAHTSQEKVVAIALAEALTTQDKSESPSVPSVATPDAVSPSALQDPKPGPEPVLVQIVPRVGCDLW